MTIISLDRKLPLFTLLSISLPLCGCGVGVPQLTEVWDRGPEATLNMEKQVKAAIYCELRKAVLAVRALNPGINEYKDVDVTTPEDTYLPDSWGAQVTLTFTVDEKTSVAPGASLNTPLHNAPYHFAGEIIGGDSLVSAFSYGPLSVPQNYALGIGGSLSSEANRKDSSYVYYTMHQLGQKWYEHEMCAKEDMGLGPSSTSSPFLITGNLGIRDWLMDAAQTKSFLRSARSAENGEGAPLSVPGFSADAISYDIKFVIDSGINASPTWTLVKVTASTAKLFDTTRSRTHELLITIGPSAEKPPRAKKIRVLLRYRPALLRRRQICTKLSRSAISSLRRLADKRYSWNAPQLSGPESLPFL